MIFYSKETTIGLFLASLPAVYSLYLYHIKSEKKLALWSLALSALCLRLLFIALDPYLQEWDERFHALVAKNMITQPFKPMLRAEALAPYDPAAWCCNHIWVHKQPLFMWQMATSMAIFGVNEWAMRLPAVVMGVVALFFVYRMAQFWTQNDTIAYGAAFLYNFSYYQLELTSGWFSLDQNDLAFGFYVTASFWALTRHMAEPARFRWPIVIGLCAGAAILVKWLTGLLVFGCWWWWLLFDRDKRRYGVRSVGSLAVCVAVFLPWQLYIKAHFPIETAAMHAQNTQHIFEALGSEISTYSYHFEKFGLLYGLFLWPFAVLGWVGLFVKRPQARIATGAFTAAIVVIYAFFSVVKTKMPAFTWPVYALIWTLIATGIYVFYQFLEKIHRNTSKYIEIHRNTSKYILFILFIGTAFYTLKPWRVVDHRRADHAWRNNRIHNAQFYKNFPAEKGSKKVILNCKSFEDTEMMFYNNINAYQWYPPQAVIDSLKQQGHRFMALRYAAQPLPAFIEQDPDIEKLDCDVR